MPGFLFAASVGWPALPDTLSPAL